MSEGRLTPGELEEAVSLEGPTEETVEKLIEVAASSAASTDILSHQLGVIESRNRTNRILIGLVLVAIVLLLIIGVGNRVTNLRTESCAVPTGKCYIENRANTLEQRVRVANDQIRTRNLIREKAQDPYREVPQKLPNGVEP